MRPTLSWDSVRLIEGLPKPKEPVKKTPPKVSPEAYSAATASFLRQKLKKR